MVLPKAGLDAAGAVEVEPKVEVDGDEDPKEKPPVVAGGLGVVDAPAVLPPPKKEGAPGAAAVLEDEVGVLGLPKEKDGVAPTAGAAGLAAALPKLNAVEPLAVVEAGCPKLKPPDGLEVPEAPAALLFVPKPEKAVGSSQK